MITALLTTVSRGSAGLASTDPKQPPRFNPNYLADPRDQEVAVQAFRRIDELARKTGAVQARVAPPDDGSVQTDAQILAWLKQNIGPWYHGTGTCKWTCKLAGFGVGT